MIHPWQNECPQFNMDVSTMSWLHRGQSREERSVSIDSFIWFVMFVSFVDMISLTSCTRKWCLMASIEFQLFFISDRLQKNIEHPTSATLRKTTTSYTDDKKRNSYAWQSRIQWSMSKVTLSITLFFWIFSDWVSADSRLRPRTRC